MSYSHTSVPFHNATFIRGELPKEPIESHAGYTHRGGAYVIEVGVGLKLGSYSACLVEWKPERALSVTHGTAKLEHWMVGALSYYSPPVVEVSLILVSR